MKQTDYNQQPNFARPGQRMQPQQQSFVQPGQRLPPNRIPHQQMTMPGGNYAPQGYPQQQMGGGMFPPSYGQQMGGFQNQQVGGWQSPTYNDPENIRDVMSEKEAEAASDKMSAMIEQLNGIDPELAEVKVGAVDGAGTVEVVHQNIQRVVDALLDPSVWVPKSRSNYIAQITPYAKKLAEKLSNFGEQIIKLK